MKYSDSSKVVLFGHIANLLLLFVKTFKCGEGNSKLPRTFKIKTWLCELSSVEKEIEQAPSEPKKTDLDILIDYAGQKDTKVLMSS